MTKRIKTKENTYPIHTTYREISSVFRDKDGNMCFSEEVDNIFYIRKTNIKDIPEIKSNCNGQRGFKKRFIDSLFKNNLVDQDFQGELFMYCIHCEEQTLKPISNFTSNKITPHLRPNKKLFGTQPFCKDCKRKYVNSGPAGNKSRTKDQHLEDLASRFRQKLIVSTLGKEKISYEEIYKKFNGCCFKCLKSLSIEDTKSKQLDHTLPHSYWWPYTTQNATLLCRDCNQAKKDKWPSLFYTKEELEKLSLLTGIELSLLTKDEPCFNLDLIEKLEKDLDNVLKKCEDRFRKKSLDSFYKKLTKESKRLSSSKNELVKKLAQKLEDYTKKRMV